MSGETLSAPGANSGRPAQASLEVFPFYTRYREKRIKCIAFSVALAIHTLMLLVQFPQRSTPPPVKSQGPVIVVKRYVPPPPRIEPRQVTRQRSVRMMPIPDPTPEEPEPIFEPVAPIPVEPTLDDDFELLLGTPEPPPMSSIALAGTGGVTMPRLIPETKREPEYPEVARLERAQGHVILQAVITKDGTVSELELLRCDKPDLGFEQAAMAAVRQWRYEPATSRGRPVDVYFTVFISFDLL